MTFSAKHFKLTEGTASAARIVIFALIVVSALPPVTAHALIDSNSVSPGPGRIPVLGMIRVPVIVLSGTGNAKGIAAGKSFFRNDLDAHTFRNYWHANSQGRFDARCFLLEWTPPENFFDNGDSHDNKPDRLIWIGHAGRIVEYLHEHGLMDPRLFDVNGPAGVPDGWMDGMIIFAPGVEGVHPYPSTDTDSSPVSGVGTGPVLVVGPGTPAVDILRGFASLLGMCDNRSSGGAPCTSLCSSDNGFPMVDAYNRTAAGWTDVIQIEGQPQTVLILPSIASGKVYRAGEKNEYFLIENRGARGDGYDLSIPDPGIVIYHVDETAVGRGLEPASPWHPGVINESPSGDTADVAASCSPGDNVFRDGDSLVPDYLDQNPPDEKHHPSNTNWYSGSPSDLVITDIDTDRHYPIITAVIGYW